MQFSIGLYRLQALWKSNSAVILLRGNDLAWIQCLRKSKQKLGGLLLWFFTIFQRKHWLKLTNAPVWIMAERIVTKYGECIQVILDPVPKTLSSTANIYPRIQRIQKSYSGLSICYELEPMIKVFCSWGEVTWCSRIWGMQYFIWLMRISWIILEHKY